MALPPSDRPAPAKPDDKAAQQDVFLREVDDALREDELKSILTRYGKPIGGAILAGLLGLAGYLWWDNSNKQAAGERSEQAIIALDKLEAGNAAAALADLEPLTKEGSDGNKAAAAMTRAAIMVQQGKTEDGAKAFAAIAADTAMPQAYRDLASIREVSIRFDAMPPQQVIDRLKPLAVPGNAWFGSAGELVGMAYLKLGKPDQAGPLFAAIGKNTDVPQTLRSRMRQVAGQLGYDAGTDDVPSLAPAQQ
ncbi:MAG: tetratricopeptide repeat protein [Novosphingobium sp.]|uniref:tetratricopeptide repeat protein n=1 Tax=Novosphingobium sp. TaxID=1874826 RepID=UPI00391BA57C|nr:tetratricopeptide repeat protein [Novosphingobium sp.]